MMAANHCLISIGVKKQSESQHCFAQIWRLVLWQFLQLLCCPIIVQIGSGWESCGWSLLFWAPNPGFHVLHLGVPSPLRPGGGFFAEAGVTQRNGTMEFHSCSSERSGVEPQGSGWSFWGLGCKIQIWRHIVSEEWRFFSLMMSLLRFLAIVFVPQSAAGFGCFCHVWGSLTARLIPFAYGSCCHVLRKLNVKKSTGLSKWWPQTTAWFPSVWKSKARVSITVCFEIVWCFNVVQV